MRMRCSGIFVLALLLAGASGARADPVTVHFGITIASTSGDLRDIFGAPVETGDLLRMRLTYDPAAPDVQQQPLYGSYRPDGSIAIDHGFGLELPLEGIDVIDHAWGVGYPSDWLGGVAPSLGIPGFDSMFIEFGSYWTADTRTDERLPQTPAEFARGWRSGYMGFAAWKTGGDAPFDSGTHEFGGQARLLSPPAPVPEPGTILLVAGGAAMLLRRRSSRSAPGLSPP